MNVYPINAGHFKLDGGAMFGVVPKTIWHKLNPADENNMCSWALRCLLIQDGEKLILVDNGMGDKQDAKFFGHYYLHGDDTLEKSLAHYGFKKEDITDVVLTHLHFDHCGGSIERVDDKLVPAFKNATFWSNERHWKWATEPNEREKASFLKENILPIRESGQLKMVDLPPKSMDAPGKAIETIPSGIIPGLSFILVNGHTEAMMLPVLDYREKIIVFAADLFPSLAHIPLPYVMSYDMFPYTTLQEKKNFLSWAIENNCILFFEHDPLVECCSLEITSKGIRAKEKFTTGDL